MSIHENPNPSASSNLPILPKRPRVLGSVNRSHSEDSQSRQESYQSSSLLQRIQSSPMYESNCLPEAPLRLRKPSFKIGLPHRDPLMLIDGPATVKLPKVNVAQVLDQPVAILQEPVLPQFLARFHLTPPEELPRSPLDTALASASLIPTSPTIDQFLSDAASMASDMIHDDQPMADLDETTDAGDDVDETIDLMEIVTCALDRLAEIPMPAMSVSVVHQPLPFPLPLRITSKPYADATLFPHLIERLRHDPRLPATAIRTSHVLSDKLPQENLPTSPPVTPSYLARNSQQGYFSIKPLFSSISPSSGLAVPPGEAMLSITERIIPPSSEFEISTFLSETTDSGFHERLSELAPGGLFITILPTRKGGETFHKDYLSKILDPILRNMVVRLGLRTEFAKDISNAIVLKQLSSFTEMQNKIQSLLSTTNDLPISSTTQAHFKLISCNKGTIQLPFEVWYSWWLGQERSRIMGLLNYHLNVQGQGIISGVSRSSIMLELEEKMQKAGAKQCIEAGIELGAFIIQRTPSNKTGGASG